jgi:YegS/Rv2252/BmrU family lipid kinase
LENTDQKTFIFIMNPTAGKHQSLELKEVILKQFETQGNSQDCIVRFTERPLHATEMAREYALLYGNSAIIYACGGDGTINEVANGIIGTEAIMSVIPAGTGNDFVKTLYSNRDPGFIIGNILNYKLKKIDSATLDGRTFVNVSSLGFDTIVGDRAKRMVAKAKFLGGSAYFVAIFVCLFGKNYSRMKYRFDTVDDQGNGIVCEKEQDFVLAAIANGEYYGGLFHPCPMAEMSDGYIDICIVDRLSIPKILSMIPKYIKGTHIKEKVVTLYKVKSGIMEAVGEKLLVNCDGESFVKDRVELAVFPASINVAYY